MSAPTVSESGRYNAVSSFFLWVKNRVATMSPLPATGLSPNTIPFTVEMRRPVTVADLAAGPILCLADLGLFSQDAADTDDVILYDTANNKPIRGKLCQTLIEFTIWGSSQIRADEDARIARIRDAMLSAYRLAGRKDPATGLFIVEPAYIYNYAANVAAPTLTNNRIRKDRASSWLTESVIEDEAHPELRAWRGVLRVWWIEFFDAP
jgi:hypothetical protein